jgi:hypothetical protein
MGINPGERALKDFVTKNRGLGKTTARVQRGPIKNQLILVGMVVAMLILLGGVLALAMRWSSPQPTGADKDVRLPWTFAVLATEQQLSKSPDDPAGPIQPIGYDWLSA